MIEFSMAIQQLEKLSEILPTPVYWINSNNVFMGMNLQMVKAYGASCSDTIIGKTVVELFPIEMATHIIQHNREVFSKGVALAQVESICDIQTKKIRHFKVCKSPLWNENGMVIGLIGSSIEITEEKEAEALKVDSLKRLNIFKHLELLAPLIPVPVYWNDLNSVALGGNQHILVAIGIKSLDEGLGKTPYDFYPREIADRIVMHNQEVIRTGQILSQEEPIVDITSGKTRYYNAYKAPLRDEDGRIFGILGVSIETTAEKEAANLQLEVETQKVILEEQMKFRKTAEQVAHDIRSPLASLMMVVKVCDSIPEKERVALREAANTINHITNNLISNYREKEVEFANKIEERESILISPTILQILTEKTYQYPDSLIKFDHQFSETGHFSWVKLQPTAFKRLLSNLINNAVESYDHHIGTVTVHLDADDDKVRISVEDKGKGMSAEIIDKIVNKIAVTEGKTNGNGIGLTQVRETLQNNEGNWVIESAVGVGTKFILTFPRTKSLSWLADSIQLNENDTIIILDDDRSIHMAWDFRFKQILANYPDMRTMHFENGQETVEFIENLNIEQKRRIFLLADYELLNQNQTGLDVIATTKISRSVLVTSHYANKEIRKLADQTRTKILPKQLASEVPIHVEKVGDMSLVSDLKIVDVIFVDDEQYLLDGYRMFALGKKVDTYSLPEEFLNIVTQYHRNTKIMLDQNFANSTYKGTQIAEQLNAMGFTRLYLLSGGNFSGLQIPAYLTLVRKTDLDSLSSALNDLS